MKTPANAKQSAVASGPVGTGSGALDQNSTPKPAKTRSARKLTSKPTAFSGTSGVGSSASGTVRVEYLNPTAREVFIAGSFNGWDLRANPLTTHGDGKWGVELTLDPGRYEYRLVVDGQWADDPRASEHTANPYGGLNSILQV